VGTRSTCAVHKAWTFDTNDLPPDDYGGGYPGLTRYIGHDWITGTVSVAGGNTVNEDSWAVDEPSYARDWVYMEDPRYVGRQDYAIVTLPESGYAGEEDYFLSQAYFLEYVDHVFQDGNPGLAFSWSPNDESDEGLGTFRLLDWNGQSYSVDAYAEYYLTSITSVSVPEPGTLALFGTVLLGLLKRRRVCRFP
jgi:PEP-CTERM motif-containing protein